MSKLALLVLTLQTFAGIAIEANTAFAAELGANGYIHKAETDAAKPPLSKSRLEVGDHTDKQNNADGGLVDEKPKPLLRREVPVTAASLAEQPATDTKVELPRGPPGPPGRAGLIVVGVVGEQGVEGEKGPQGPQGVQGPRGPPGAAIIGPRGEKGVVGDRGPRGRVGPAGDQGVEGPMGPVGNPPEKFQLWNRMLKHFSAQLSEMETSRGFQNKKFGRDVSALHQRVAVNDARLATDRKSTGKLKGWVSRTFKRARRSSKDARKLDQVSTRMGTQTSKKDLVEAERLLPVMVETERAAQISRDYQASPCAKDAQAPEPAAAAKKSRSIRPVVSAVAFIAALLAFVA